MNTILLCALLSCALPTPFSTSTAPIGSDDWPQYMGPYRTGHAHPETLEGVDFDWSTNAPRVLWRTEVGPGYGGAAVHNGEVFLLDREVGEMDILRVMELATGEPVWDAVYDAPGRLDYAGSRTVPTVTDKYVITCGGQGQVICFDRGSREEIWSVALEQDFGGVRPSYGWSCSPLLIDDMVVLSAMGPEVGLVALDVQSGDEVWVTKSFGISHSTPVLLELLGEQQIVFVSAGARPASLDAPGTLIISSFSPVDGELLWETETVGTVYPIPGPVQVGDDRIFVTGGYRGGSALLRVSEGSHGYAFETLFHIERGAQIHNPIVHGEHIYFLANENWNTARARRAEGGLACLALDGTERWRTGDAPNFGRGNALLAGDCLLIQDGFNGTLRAVRATPEGYEELGSANLFGIEDRRDHQMWGTMALAGRRLLMRSQDELICVQL